MSSFKQIRWFICLLWLSSIVSCNKKALLDKKPSSNTFIPTTLDDFRYLLDNDFYMNETPALGELSADNFYLLYPFWQLISTKERNAFIWAPDIYEKQGIVDDWNLPYKQVFYANVVLEAIEKLPITSANELEWRAVKGTALFIRGNAFYNLSQVFATVYDSATANKDLGIPIRLKPDIEETSVRATVKQSYDQLLADLKEASSLLPRAIEFNNRNRPCKPAALALLARAYLSMRAYGLAGTYADSCLQLYAALVNYDTIKQNVSLPFTRFNAETLYQSRIQASTDVLESIRVPDCIVDSGLYRSYATNDLRKIIFFTNGTNGPNTKGGYSGSIFTFSGLATDEVYLIRAECKARANDPVGAMEDLNYLLSFRWKANTFVPMVATTVAEALAVILQERRKELVFRGQRFTDLRRLNKEGANITLTRILNGETYTLRPNERRYVLPIPPDVIQLTGMPQNSR